MASKSGPSACEELFPAARAWVIPTTKSASTTPSAKSHYDGQFWYSLLYSFQGSCSYGGLLSSCLLSAKNFRDEDSLGIYRENEAYSAARFPSPYDLERTLDGRGSDPRLVCERTLANLDGNAYHLGDLLSLEGAHAASHSGAKSGTRSSETSTSR